MASMYDKELVLDILDQIAEVIFGICQDHIDDLLVVLKQMRSDLSK